MPSSSHDQTVHGRRYALCIGIGIYTNIRNRNLKFATNDARGVAQRLESPLPDSFEVTLLTEPTQTSKAALNEAVEHLLSAPDRQTEDLAVLYFSCHGDLSASENTFCLLPSDATAQPDGKATSSTVISISDFSRWLSQARMRNIVLLLDVCHSGGAGAAVQNFPLPLGEGPNYFIIGGARLDQEARQSSRLGHGMFTHCLLRAFEQPPVKEGWLTISQIHSFVSEEIRWFAQGQPTMVQGVSISVNPNLALLRNPSYPELCPVPPIWTIPQQRNPFFTGQEEVLARLTTMLHQEQRTALSHPQAIAGLGGIGKTQLALEYAYRHRQDYHAILWSLADTREALISTFMSVASLLNLPEQNEQDQMVTVEAVKRWLAGRSKWLLILDNADELDIVKEFIPPAFQGHLLITTRSQVTGALAHKIEVDVMSPETGALLLLRRAGLLAPDAPLEKTPDTEVVVAKDLATELGGLPLALDQAGAYIETVGCSLQDYQQRYRTHRADLLRKRGGVAPDHSEPVATTWSLSFQKIEQTAPVAADLLRTCAFLSPDAIPEEIIIEESAYLGPILQEQVSNPLAFDETISALRAYSLIRRDPAAKLLSIHRLVQAVLRDSMDEVTVRQWVERVVRAVNAIFPLANSPNWPQSLRYLPQVFMCATLIEGISVDFGTGKNLFTRAGEYLEEHARYVEAEVLYELALKVDLQSENGKLFPPFSQVTLAFMYEKLGKITEAEKLFAQYVTMSKEKLGSVHIGTSSSMSSLGEFYQRQGEYGKAEEMYQAALEIHEQVFGANHPLIARHLDNFIQLYIEQKKVNELEAIYRRVLALCEQQKNTPNNQLIGVATKLAHFYSQSNKQVQARQLYQQVSDLRKQMLTTQHSDPQSRFDLLYLGNFHLEQDQFAEAESFYQQGLALCEKQFGVSHSEITPFLQGLANCYKFQGKYTEAEELYLRELNIVKKYDYVHPSTAGCLSSLASLCMEQGKFTEAEQLWQEALGIWEELNPHDSFVAHVLRELALLNQQQGKYNEAESYYLRALAIYEQSGSSFFDKVHILDDLAQLYELQKKYGEAELFYQRALQASEQSEDASLIAYVLNNLGRFNEHQEKYEAAEMLYRQALAICEQQLSSTDSQTIIIVSNLALCYHAQGKDSQSKDLLESTLAMLEQQLGPNHEMTCVIRENYTWLLRDTGQKTEASQSEGITKTFAKNVYSAVKHLFRSF